MDQPTTLIIGAGVFGVSTAYHLAQKASDPSRIILLDRGTQEGASADINKIIRADYSDPMYMKLGFEAIDAWKSLPFFRDADVYHQSGWIAMDEKDSDLPQRIRENFRDGNHDGVLTDMSENEVRDAWGGVLRHTDCSPFGSFYFNQSAGWVDAGKALQVMLDEAIKLGIRYETGEVRRLLFSPEAGLQGVEMDGRTFVADRVLLATGAWTSKLMSSLEDTLDIQQADRVEEQVTAAGVCVAHFHLNEEEKEIYSKLPVLVYGGQGSHS